MIGLFARKSDPAFKEFVRVANLNSQFPWFVSWNRDRIYDRFNLTKGAQVIIMRKSEVVLTDEAPFEVWDKTESLEDFINRRLVTDIDILEPTPYF